MRTIKDLSVPKTYSVSFDGFKGYSDGEQSDGKTVTYAENISDSLFPSLSPRPRRAVLGKYGRITSFLADETPVRIENYILFVGDTQVSNEKFPDYYRHSILRIGNYYVVLPRGFYVNVSDITDCGFINRIVSVGNGGNVKLITVDGSYQEITEYTVSRTRPPAAEAGDLWAKPKDVGGYEMKRYDGYEWRPYESYVRIEYSSLSEKFKIGDVLECTGAQDVLGPYVKVCHADSTGIYFEGAAPQLTVINYFALKRLMPQLQHATVSGGRIVGVFCGRDDEGNPISKAYASAVNDPFCWFEAYGGLSADIGGETPFTAIEGFGEDTVAFRENSITRIKVSNDKISFSVTECEGVASGGELSTAYINGSVYYKSPTGVYAYGGSFPKKISAPLGEAEVCDGSTPGGVYDGKYYIRLKDKKGRSHIYVYNTLSGGWSIEDDPGVTEFVQKNRGLIAVCEDGDGSFLVLWDHDGASESLKGCYAKDGYPIVEKPIRWFFETGEVYADIGKGYFPSRVFLKARLKAGGSISVGCICNGGSVPDKTVNVTDRTDTYFEIPMLVSRCTSLRLRVSGRGNAEVLGYVIEYAKETV